MTDSEHANLSVEQVLGVVRRRAPWIFLCCVLVAGAAYGLSKHQTKKYTATASLVFNDNQQAQQVAGLAVANSNEQVARENTNLRLVELGDMAEKTASRLGSGLTKEKVKQAIGASAQGESNVVDVSATATSPTLAADIANTYTKLFVNEQRHSNHAYYASALRVVDGQLAAMKPKQRLSAVGVALQNRAQSLGVLAELQNGNVEVAQSAAVPVSPSSPKITKDTVLGAVLGLIIGLAVGFLLERLDRRIREPKDLEAIYALPLLGVVPESKALSRLTSLSVNEANATLPPGEAEAFHLIRAHLRYFNVDRELRTLLVASAAPGDGKTTVARHLSAAAARMGSRVLLLEADLRRPTLARQLGIQSGAGLADVLIGAIPFSEAIRTIGLTAPTGEGSSDRTMDVLVAGAALPPNPGELTESHAMERLLEEAKASYDLIVIDSPPLTVVSDAFPLLREVDGVLIVGRVGRNRRDVAERLHEILTGVDAPLLGVIANGFKARGLGSYGYSYEYSYAPAKQQKPATKQTPATEQRPTTVSAAGSSSSSNGEIASSEQPQTTGKS